MKRWMIPVVALLMALCAVCASAETDGFTYDDWYGGVKTYSAPGGEVTVPAVIDGEAMTHLADSLLEDNPDITSLTIPEGYTVSGRFVANNCANLTALHFPESLVVIGNSSFQNLTGVTELTIPAGVALIGSNALSSGGFTSVTFEGVPPIMESGALSWLPDEVVFHVPDDCFDEYEALLTDIHSWYTVVPSGQNAVTVDRTCPESDFVLDESGLLTAYTGTDPYVVIPQTVNGVQVTGIGEGVFTQQPQKVWIVKVPEGMEELGRGAFKNSKVAFVQLPDSLRTISDEAFCQYEGTISGWPASLEEIGDSAFAFMFLGNDELYLPEGLKRIGESAFADTRVYHVYFPSTLESIGAHAFDNTFYTGYITYLNFASAVLPRIGEDAFASEAATLADVDMPWDCSREDWEEACGYFASIGAQSCTVWRNNPISAGVAAYPDKSEAEIINGVWSAYTGQEPDLTVWTDFDGVHVTALGDGVFKGNQTIHSFYPHHCGWFTTIGAEAFAGSAVAYVEMFDSITAIGSRAFADCPNLTEITLPAELTRVAADAFDGCGLHSVTIACDPAVLPDGLFASCADLGRVTFETGLSVEETLALRERLGLGENAVCLRKDGTELAYAKMPYEETNAADFLLDETGIVIDGYTGYELNLYLPRQKDYSSPTTLGENALDRAKDHDYTDTCELPVKSVTVPETYMEIAPGAFAYLPTVETIIIYAPMAEVYPEMFTACTMLKHVIFVNGAKQVDKDAFIGCYALESVYFGPDCRIDEDAFGYATPEVLQELPDVDAMLAAVKADPMPVPTEAPIPTETSVPEESSLPAAAESRLSDSCLGTWYVILMGTGAQVIQPVQDWHLVITLTLNEDGSYSEDYTGTSDGHWTADSESGALVLEGGGMDGYRLCLREDGLLQYGEIRQGMVFARDSETTLDWQSELNDMGSEVPEA